jgi:uncharacterized glyoxalase superfamily protein PhnB/ketosteroid isomerase-like protein
LKPNRSIPPATVIPVLIYPDVRQAVDWLREAFGFVERVRIGEDHRSQLSFGEGAVIVGDTRAERRPPRPGEVTHSVMVRVDDANAHCERARLHGARIVREPTDFEYGERQYTAEDPAGHQWTFSQTLADVAPEEWGGTTVSPAGLAGREQGRRMAIDAFGSVHGGVVMATTGVAQRNIELARKGYAAFNSGDVDAVMNLLADDVVWHVFGSGPLAGDHKGKQAVMELFGNYLQLLDSQSTEVHDILANDQHTVVMAILALTRGGQSIEHRITDVIHPDPEGRVQEFWRFFDDQGKADAFLSG